MGPPQPVGPSASRGIRRQRAGRRGRPRAAIAPALDFTTASHSLFARPARLVQFNVKPFDAARRPAPVPSPGAAWRPWRPAGRLGAPAAWTAGERTRTEEWNRPSIARRADQRAAPFGSQVLGAANRARWGIATWGCAAVDGRASCTTVATPAAGGYHMEYGYSCMGYRTPAAWGSRWRPVREYSFWSATALSDENSEIGPLGAEGPQADRRRPRQPGFGASTGLQKSVGGESSTTVHAVRAEGEDRPSTSRPMRRLGAQSEKVAGIAEFGGALERAKRPTRPRASSSRPTPRPHREGGAWWDVAVPEVSDGRRCARRARLHRGDAEKRTEDKDHGGAHRHQSLTWTNDDMRTGGETPLEVCLCETSRPAMRHRTRNKFPPRPTTEADPGTPRNGLVWAGTAGIADRSVADEKQAVENHLKLLLAWVAGSWCSRGVALRPWHAQTPLRAGRQAPSEWPPSASADRDGEVPAGSRPPHGLPPPHGTWCRAAEDVRHPDGEHRRGVGLLLDTGTEFAGPPGGHRRRLCARITTSIARREGRLRSKPRAATGVLKPCWRRLTVPGDAASTIPRSWRPSRAGTTSACRRAEQDPAKAHPMTYCPYGFDYLKKLGPPRTPPVAAAPSELAQFPPLL
jgi:hypothetical protein